MGQARRATIGSSASRWCDEARPVSYHSMTLTAGHHMSVAKWNSVRFAYHVPRPRSMASVQRSRKGLQRTAGMLNRLCGPNTSEYAAYRV